MRSAAAASDLLNSCAGDPRVMEARIFALVSDMIAGRLPELSRQTPDDRRRLGYLAEVAALLLGAPERERLLLYAAEAAADRVPPSPDSVIPLVPGGAISRGWEHDGLAAAWGISPGLDVARYRSESAAIAQASR